MKKTKLFLTVLCVGSVLSCTKDSDLTNANEPVEVILEAFSGEDDVETKTVRQSDGATWWADGDQISLFFGNGNNGGSCFTTATGGETASFSGTLNAFTAGGEGYAGETTYFWGVYPYSASNTCDNNSVTLNIPSVQPGVAGTFGPGVNISVGRSENLKMGFYNVCSGFSFSVSTEGITELMFKANNDAPIVGDATVEFVTGKPAVTSLTNGSSEIHIFPEGGTFEVDQKYYLEFIPTTLDGFTVTIYNNRIQEASYEYTSSRTFQRGMFTSISNINTRVGEWTARKGNITFADPNFKAYCVENFDTDNDGEISCSEAAAAKSIMYNSQSATSLDEICFFTSLEKLECHNNQLSSLDVSNNTALTKLSCAGNQLTTLDVSNNTALIWLECNSNQLTTLDVSNNTSLIYLGCGNNQLTKLDINKNTVLAELLCSFNQLTALDVSRNTALKNLYCDHIQLTSLDVSKNTSLAHLNCSFNQLTALDVSKNTALKSLLCQNNQLTSLDVSKNTALKYLHCYKNQLSSLDVSKNTALTILYCSPMNDENGQNLLRTLYIYNGQSINGITSNRYSRYIPDETIITDSNPGSGEGTGEEELEGNIDFEDSFFQAYCVDNFDSNGDGYISYEEAGVVTSIWCPGMSLSSIDEIRYFTALEILGCGNNNIGSIDVSNNLALTSLDCSDNILSSLDISKNTALQTLSCSDNDIMTLDLSKNTNLTGLSCRNNQLTELDLSNNDLLYSLDIGENLITSINISNCASLKFLDCGRNNLTALNLSNITNLENLYCGYNQLTSLDVSKATALKRLNCAGNRLSRLNVSNNTELVSLSCDYNRIVDLNSSLKNNKS